MEMINMGHDLTKLQNEINEEARRFNIPRLEIPEYVSENLKYNFFDWQKDSMEYFLTYEAIKKLKIQINQLILCLIWQQAQVKLF